MPIYKTPSPLMRDRGDPDDRTLLAELPRHASTLEIVHATGTSDRLQFVNVKRGISPAMIVVKYEEIEALRAALDEFEDRVRLRTRAPARAPRGVPRGKVAP